ncbi:MAG: hypothetical protein U5K79_15365 [Cyclobacteriaceae bacterium]|nr:hypothetical protein [Cyclobacteriaceae bacterium]
MKNRRRKPSGRDIVLTAFLEALSPITLTLTGIYGEKNLQNPTKELIAIIFGSRKNWWTEPIIASLPEKWLCCQGSARVWIFGAFWNSIAAESAALKNM